MNERKQSAEGQSLTVTRIAEIRRGAHKGKPEGEMTHAEWNELLTLAQEALRARKTAEGTDERFSDERLRAIASRHAREAVCPLGSREHPGDPVVMQEKIRAEEVIFYALKEACAQSATADSEHARLWREWSKRVLDLPDHNFPGCSTFAYLRDAMRRAFTADSCLPTKEKQ